MKWRRSAATAPLLRTTARQVLCSPSDDSYDMVVVLSGGLEVADDSHGRNLLFAQPGPGQFAGELNLLTGQRPFVTIRVTAAAVYGASEGLEVAVLEAAAPGGQAGSTSRIENYLGFPQGISGAELTTRATIQAQKFGALLASPCRVDRLAVTGKQFSVLLADGTTLSARTVVAATGAVYRRLPLAGWRRTSREPGSTTRPRTWRRDRVPVAPSSSLAAEIRPARQRSIWPGDALGSRSSAGMTLLRHRCRST